MFEASPITNLYIMLQRVDELSTESDERSAFRQKELDRLYRQIVSLPIDSLGNAIDKLAFADHCLSEEHDTKEALNIIRAVSAGLVNLQQVEEDIKDTDFPLDGKNGIQDPPHKSDRLE
jgi:hypothetical protein